MTYRIIIQLSAEVPTLDHAVQLVAALSTPGFSIQDLSIFQPRDHMQQASPPETVEPPKSVKPKVTKPVADPAPAPASAAAEAPAPAPAPASPKAPTHADLRAILVPAAGGGKNKEVTAFVKGGNKAKVVYATVDSIPAADLPGLIAEAKELFA